MEVLPSSSDRARAWLVAAADVMKAQNVTPSRMTYNVVLSMLGEARQLDRALELFAEMKAAGLPATMYEYGTLLSACGRDNRVETAYGLLKEAVQEMEKKDGLGNCYTQMMKVLGKAGRWQEAELLLGQFLVSVLDVFKPPTCACVEGRS